MRQTRCAYQFDPAGLFLWETVSHESPEEPGHFLVPALCTLVPPPQEIPDGRWPRWNGVSWDLVTRPAAPAALTPQQKLQAFLDANPDVLEMIGQ